FSVSDAMPGRDDGSNAQYGIAGGDLDGDGKPEVVASHVNDLLGYNNLSSPGSISFHNTSTFSLPTTGSWGLAVGDLDGDGRPEVVAADSSTIGIFQNTVLLAQQPSVSITNPFPGAVFSAPSPISVGASAAVSNGTLARVDFYTGTNL